MLQFMLKDNRGRPGLFGLLREIYQSGIKQKRGMALNDWKSRIDQPTSQ